MMVASSQPWMSSVSRIVLWASRIHHQKQQTFVGHYFTQQHPFPSCIGSRPRGRQTTGRSNGGRIQGSLLSTGIMRRPRNHLSSTISFMSTLTQQGTTGSTAIEEGAASEAAVPENNNRPPQLQKWSKKRLAETTAVEQMKPIIADIALRLSLQWDMLHELQNLCFHLQQEEPGILRNDSPHVLESMSKIALDWWSTSYHRSDPKKRLQISQTLESLYKTIHSMKVLHEDTRRQCELFHSNFPDSTTITPLFQRQMGQAFKEIYARHALSIETMAEIVIDFRGILLLGQDHDDSIIPAETMLQVQTIVTKILKSRLLSQLLCDHIVDCTLYNRERKPHGAIAVNVTIHDLVQSAIIEARHLVEANFIPVAKTNASREGPVDEEPPEPPQVLFLEPPMVSKSDKAIKAATLVRPWFQYALVELLKNSLAVTMERNRRPDDHSPFWPLHVHIYETNDNIVVQLFDQGGGFSYRPTHRDNFSDCCCLCYFEFANRRDKWDRMDEQQTYAIVRSPIRGLGVGLALSRLHLRMFGGDLILDDRPEGIIHDGTAMSINDGEEGPAPLQLQKGATATLLLAKDSGTLETNIYDC